jgi:hypothetical protein
MWSRNLSKRGVAYIHLIEGNEADVRHGGRIVPSSLLRPLFKGVLIVCGDYTVDRAEKILNRKRERTWWRLGVRFWRIPIWFGDSLRSLR